MVAPSIKILSVLTEPERSLHFYESPLMVTSDNRPLISTPAHLIAESSDPPAVDLCAGNSLYHRVLFYNEPKELREQSARHTPKRERDVPRIKRGVTGRRLILESLSVTCTSPPMFPGPGSVPTSSARFLSYA